MTLQLLERAPPTLPRIVAELRRRQPALAALGLVLLALALPTAIASLLDPRLLGGVSVWTKPLKFMLSASLFALTAAWFFGYLPQARRRAWPARLIVWTVLVTASFEIAYITLQGALGQRSHFNDSSVLHQALFQLMGLAAVLLTATAGLLAQQIAHHGERDLAPAYRLAVVLGLAMTAALGIISGAAIGANGGYAVAVTAPGGLPLFGWSTSGGDLRVAHFFGLHAEQVLPLLGALLVALVPRRAGLLVWSAGALYLLLALGVLLQALAGRPFLPL